MTRSPAFRSIRAIAAAVAFGLATAAAPPPTTAAPISYADLADLADAAQVAVHAVIRKAIPVPAERAGTVPAGHARVYVEAQTTALLAGSEPLGESLRYLVDMPLDTRGKLPKLKKRAVLLFARTVPGRPGELQLVGKDGQLDWSPALGARAQAVLAELAAADAAPAVTGVRDALSVPGTLAGESETQVFLATRSGDPVSLTVIRRPGMTPAWGVSFSEIVDQAARPPARETLAWYRLACFLPAQLPPTANLASDTRARAQAAADYAFVMRDLGPCQRSLGPA